MKKQLLLLLCFFSICAGYGQKVLIPYRVGSKFGLSDEKGKIILKPQYESIDYIDKDFFCAATLKAQTDAKKAAYNDDNNSYSLLRGTAVMLENQKYPNFFIYENLIANSSNPYHAEGCTIYNFKGELLINESIKGAYINDDRDVGYLARPGNKYSFISLFQFDENHDRVFSIALYDKTTQKIESWLVRKVKNYKLSNKGANFAQVSYTDETGNTVNKYIGYKNNTYVISNVNQFGSLPNNGNAQADVESMPRPDYDPGDISIGTRSGVADSDEQLEKRHMIYYKLKNDSLLYTRGDQKTYVKPDGAAYILINDKISQMQPVIFKQQRKYGLVLKGVKSEVLYDSILYFGKNYIVAKTINRTIKYGIINSKGLEIAPAVFDSVSGTNYTYVIESKNDTGFISYFGKNDSYSKTTNRFVKNSGQFINVFSNGKRGLLDVEGNTIIPPAYEMIAQNDILFAAPRQSNFTLLKKDGKYSATFLQYNNQKRVMKNTTMPFKNVPCYYFDNYYAIPGYKIYGIFDDNFKFLGYANQNGTLYYKD